MQEAGLERLSAHVTHYGPRLGFPLYNITTPIERAPIYTTRGRAELFCGVDSWEPLPVLKQ